MNKKTLIITSSFLMGLGIVLLVFFLFHKPKTPEPIVTEVVEAVTPAIIEDPENLNVLLLGYGGAGHSGGYLTDTIMMVHVNFEKKVLGLIFIPRDLWVNNAKINAAFAKGLTEENVPTKNLDDEEVTERGLLTKGVFEKVTGFPVDHFIAVDFNGFQRAIGELGGIEVDVKKSLDDPWYPVKGRELELCGMTNEEIAEAHANYSGFQLERQFECRYERIVYDIGTHEMEGGDALDYVRSRHSSSDFDRGRRAQEVLVAIKKKLLDLDALENSLKFFKDLSYTLQSDIDASILENLVPALTLAKDFKVVEIRLSPENTLVDSKSSGGAYILLPAAGDGNFQQVQNYIAEELSK